MAHEPDIVDLRSDTVTRPGPAMRRAMAEAVVGDDVLGDDPTVVELERRVAALAGKEAALFVPSGTMGNQIAVLCHTRPGDEVVVEARAHVFLWEQGGIGANAGCTTRVIAGEGGTIAPEAIDAAVRDTRDDHVARVSLLCVENTHNGHGGTVVPLEALHATIARARAHGLAVHLDGARLWNASVATGVPIATWAALADTVMMCFSKGMGAPIGSVLAGPGATMRAARRARKRLGGGMRQVGVIAAACLVALDQPLERLADDHRRARRIADALAAVPGVRVPRPDTNIVFVWLDDPRIDRDRVVAAAAGQGVRVGAFGPRLVRAVTHGDVDDAGVERASRVLVEAIEAARIAAVDAPGSAC
jgi:threonine aldolase